MSDPSRGRTARSRVAAAVRAVLVVLALGTAGPAAAAPAVGDDVAWSVRPADGAHGTARDNFRYEARPGDRIEDAVVVTNRGTAPLELRVYGADGGLNADGHVDLAPADAVPTALGAWLALEAATLSLAPGESAEVPFTLVVPADAAAGAVAGGVVTSSLGAGGAPGVALDRRLAVSVVVTVDGTPSSADDGEPAGEEAREDAEGGGPAPRTLALLGVLGLLVVAAGVWGFVLRGRATS